MALSARDRGFLAKRRRIHQYMPYLFVGLLVIVVGFVAWLLVSGSLLVRPFAVIARVQEQTLEESTLVTMAVMLPMVFWAVLVLMGLAVVGLFVALWLERRYLRMIDELVRESGHDE